MTSNIMFTNPPPSSSRAPIGCAQVCSIPLLSRRRSTRPRLRRDQPSWPAPTAPQQAEIVAKELRIADGEDDEEELTSPTTRRLLHLLQQRGIYACCADLDGWLLVDDGTGKMELVPATFPAVHQRLYGY